jgi:single-strand DNA-binding protein
MSNLNKVIVSGNLGADADLRFTKAGIPVANFRLASNQDYRDADGKWQRRVEWVSCVVFGNRAEGLAPLLTKGREVTVDGSLHTNRWEDREGNTRYSTQVKAKEVNLGRLPRSQQEAKDSPAPEASEDDAQKVLEELEQEEKSS